jgi:opacity protein-like surface antigen
MKALPRLAAGLVLGLLFAPRPAAAQFLIAGGVHLGYSKTTDAPHGSFVGGAQLRFRLLSFIGAEALAEYRQTTYQAGGVDVLRVKDFPVQLSAMLYVVPAGPFQLYLLGGFGCHFTKSEGLGPNEGTYDTSQTKWAPHAGGGFEIWTGQSFFISADLRYVFLSVSSVSNLENQLQSGSLSASFWEATAGLNYKF